jgi:hypothetical protein
MAADTNENAKKINIWVDGVPSADLQADSTDLKRFTYWIDGTPYLTAYPSITPTLNTGAMMQLIWGVG